MSGSQQLPPPLRRFRLKGLKHGRRVSSNFKCLLPSPFYQIPNVIWCPLCWRTMGKNFNLGACAGNQRAEMKDFPHLSPTPQRSVKSPACTRIYQLFLRLVMIGTLCLGTNWSHCAMITDCQTVKTVSKSINMCKCSDHDQSQNWMILVNRTGPLWILQFVCTCLEAKQSRHESWNPPKETFPRVVVKV